MTKRILITGGAGFIGSALIRYLIEHTDHHIINFDKLTYASDLTALTEVSDSPRYHFIQADVCDALALDAALQQYQPDHIMHLAAESHVDRSISGADAFIQTNIVGTYQLLEAARRYYSALVGDKRAHFRLHHISTDEVYGDLAPLDDKFTEATAYAPSSPYSASKAASDHLVNAWQRTYGLPTVMSNCSNNYGPYQHTEKLIPLMITNALKGQLLPIYGNGQQVRDWLYVDDHVRGLYQVLCHGEVGQTYNIGGHNEMSNLEVVHKICHLLEALTPHKPAGVVRYADLITHVDDRLGHDVRYAVDTAKIQAKLGWQPVESFDTGLEKTVNWYLAQQQ